MCQRRPLRVAGQRALTHVRAGVERWSHSASAQPHVMCSRAAFETGTVGKTPYHFSLGILLLIPLVASLAPLTTKYCLLLVIFVSKEQKDIHSRNFVSTQNSLYHPNIIF